jgi:hemerythrin-like domain-containing protein
MTVKMEAATGVSAIDMLKEDHQKVKQLFEEFEQAEDAREKQDIVMQAIQELKVHTALEEEIFYPAVQKVAENEDLIPEAEEEHAVAKTLIAELEDMSASDDHYDAKFTVLAESVQHHIEEEENEMLPEAESRGLDLFQLGEEMAQRRQEILGEVREESAPKQSKSRSSHKGKSHKKTKSR